MDFSGGLIISNIFTAEELELTPTAVQEKLITYLEAFFDEYCKNKAAANRLVDYEQKTEDLQALIKDYELKIENFKQNVSELRSQLDVVSNERIQLQGALNMHEKEICQLRSEKKMLADERDDLLKMLERQNNAVERFQEDMKVSQQQLKAAISAKCEALARIDEIESKELSFDFKERRMEQERDMFQKQIQTLTEDLNRTVNDLQDLRRENRMQSMHLETNLMEKTEELKIIQNQCAQYKETIEELTQKTQELNSSMLSQKEQTQKMMEHYKKELDAKAKLADLYKNNCQDTEMQSKELMAALNDLKRMLSEASAQYGELETSSKATQLNLEKEMEEKNKLIESMKAELAHANDLLKEVQQESLESAISKLAPTAAISSRLIRADMSLTELYSLYVKTSEELELQKRENARLNLQLKKILSELDESAPGIKKQEIEYEKLLETNNILTLQLDDLISKKADMQEVLMEAHSKISFMDRENRKLKQSQNDLSRQVCLLLREVEQLRIGLLCENKHGGGDGSGDAGGDADGDAGGDAGGDADGDGNNSTQTAAGNNVITTNDVISKKLVTFNSIVELQENNQKLLTLVRDLSGKVEAAEAFKQEMDEACYQEKLEQYTRKVENMQDTLNQQNSTVATLLNKCERYKKLYFELQKTLRSSSNSSNTNSNNKYNGLRHRNDETNEISDMDEDDGEVCEDEEDAMIADNDESCKNSPNKNKNVSAVVKENERRIKDLEQQLDDTKDQYKTLKEQYDYYIQEKKNNEKILNEQFDAMRTEVRELTSSNCKLASSLEYAKGQISLQQKNAATHKQQIAALEERSKNYENTIIKHEQTILYLKDETMKATRTASAAESEIEQLRHENHLLKDTIGRLQSEKDIYHRNQQNQNMMLNNLELIKLNLERWETEGRSRMEQRLDDTVRELAAQRRHFQEEEERLRESINDLNRQTETAKNLLEEEKLQSTKLSAEMENVRQQLLTKTQQVDELSRKLQNSLTPSKNDNPIALANKKARDFEMKYENAQIEIDSLNSELKKVREHAEQYHKMSQSAETEINNLHEMHTKLQAELKELRDNEFNMKSRISELEAEIQLAAVIEIPDDNKPDELKKSQNELKNALQKLSECNRNLRSLREDNIQLSESLSNVETKYANEMVAHSNDIKELTKLKADLIQTQGQIKEIIAERDSAKIALEDLRHSQAVSLNGLVEEKEELENRVKCLDLISTVFHDQVEDLTNRLMLLSQGPITQGPHSDSKLMDTSDIIESESDNKNSDQLLQIIKYLRKEKDLTVAKLDILKAENSRLQAELAMLRKKNDELQDFLNREQAKTTANVVSVSKHEQILRKVETLNAVTDSNRVLREERNSLAERVKELNVRISALEEEIFPLQNTNHDLKAKIDELTSENTSLRTEAMKWRQRANVLVEKSNKNPEEFKRLQSERENLAKMLTAEKEQIKHLNDELNANKLDKSRMEVELATLQEEKKSCLTDLNVMKQTNSRLMQEIMELKSKLLYKEEHIQNSIDELAAKDKQLIDMKSKEAQIRKIAKRYKDLYTAALSKTFRTNDEGDDLASSIANAAAAMAVGGHDSTEIIVNVAGNLTRAEGSTESELRNSIDNLNNVIRSLQDENEKIRKDYDDLKATSESDERTKVMLLDARTHIANLAESRDVVSHELTATKNKLLQNAEAHESALNEMKTQYEDTVSRMQKELSEQNNRNKDDMQRLQRENESLIIRINQLNRQLGLQQSAKPSTSSVTISDKGNISDASPRTANVKPMSGSTSVQQSATVTPWRGSETPLASIRPISVQNTRTAAILPTSQQTSGSSVGVAGTSSSTSTSSTSTSSSSSGSSSSTAGSGSGGNSCNTALVPPQQQVHTTGSSSLETMSSSPTSSHTDFMPSTSTSVSVAVATIPPMGSTSVAESSQEAESLQQTQQNETQATHVSGGTSSSTSTSSSQIQVVALVSPRVEGSLTTTSSSQTTTTSPNIQIIQDAGNQQPSTSGSGGCSSHVTVSSHSRHAPSSSNVTTTQAGTSAGHKRPRDTPEGDSSTSAEDQDKHPLSKHPKRMRAPMHGVDISLLAVGVTDSGIDVDQVPTSSQRDQEDDVVIVDSEDDDDGMAEAEADDEPTDGDADHEVYEDSYDQDQDMDESDCPEINESNMRADVGETDNNEADVNEGSENQAQCTSAGAVVQLDTDAYNAPGASTSAAAAALSKAHSQQQDNNQQSQAISSGSGESSNWKQSTTTTTTTLTRQQKATLMMLQQGAQQGEPNDTTESSTASRRTDTVDLVSSPQDSKCGQTSDTTSGNSAEQSSDVNKVEVESKTNCGKENVVLMIEKEFSNSNEFNTNKNANTLGTAGLTTSDENKSSTMNEDIVIEVDDFNDEEDTGISEELPGNTSNATQSEQSQMETTLEDNEGTDGVSSEGEKQAVEEVEEEGREAEATTTPSINTRSKSTKNVTAARRCRGFVRGSNRPTPILWRESPGTSRNTVPMSQRNVSAGSTMTGVGNNIPIGTNSQDQQNIFRNFTNQRGQRARRNRRPPGNFSNMRYN